MKKMLMLVSLFALLAGCVTDEVESKKNVYNGIVYTSSGDIVPGQWTCQYTKARIYAIKNRLPMIFFWGNKGCGICENAERSMSQPDFVAWQRSKKCVFVFTVNNAVGGSEATLMKNDIGYIGTYPGVGFYWPKDGANTKPYDAKINGSMTGATVIQKANEVFGK